MTFAVPWNGCTYLGTTEVDHPGPGDEPRITRAEVDYLLAAGRRAFPDTRLGHDDIISTWAGLRPLVGAKPGQSPSQVKRDFTVSVSGSGLAVLAGGKLTGFRAMAAAIIDRLFPTSRSTAARAEPPPFPGSGVVPDMSIAARRTGVDAAWLRQRTAAYGSRVGALADELPAGATGPDAWLRAQTRFAVTREMAQTVSDVLRRRTVLMLVERDNALAAAPAVASEMARLLSWSDTRRARELEGFRAEVAALHAWRQDGPRIDTPPRPRPLNPARSTPHED
jgi:glycerol-3-phosphate dehydrogenase